MSQTTILKCDRCGESWDQNKPDDEKGQARRLYKLSLLQHEHAYRYGPSNQPHFTVDWCRTCVDRFQVLWPREPKTPTDPPAPTPSERLESLIRELAREEADAAVQEAR